MTICGNTVGMQGTVATAAGVCVRPLPAFKFVPARLLGGLLLLIRP